MYVMFLDDLFENETIPNTWTTFRDTCAAKTTTTITTATTASPSPSFESMLLGLLEQSCEIHGTALVCVDASGRGNIHKMFVVGSAKNAQEVSTIEQAKAVFATHGLVFVVDASSLPALVGPKITLFVCEKIAKTAAVSDDVVRLSHVAASTKCMQRLVKRLSP